jgi:hypothetical protein
MSLLGFFFSKRFLKLILIVASIFILLQFSRAFLSFGSGLDLLLQVTLITFVLILLTGLSIRYERLKFLSGMLKFLCLTVVPLILVFSFVLPASIPFPLSTPVKLGALVFPFGIYILYRRKLWIWARSSSVGGERRQYGRLSRNALLPGAMEDGHIVYNAGIKGFKVLRFIQIDDQQLDSIDEHVTEAQFRLATPELSELLSLIKKRRIEVSYELYLRNEALQEFVGFMCEGRDYREIRTAVDDLSRKLVRDLSSMKGTVGAAASLVEDSIRAGRILAMPLSTAFEDLRRIENDDYNAKVFGYNDSEKPTKLRPIYVSGLSLVSQGQDINVVDEVAQAAFAQRTQKDFACILHIKPLSNHTIDQELVKAGRAYEHAMTRFIEVMRNGFFDGKVRNKAPLFNRGKIPLDPRNIIEESKSRLQRLKEAEEAGYFEVSLAIIGEPAVAEVIARLLKNKLSQKNPSAALFLVHAPPTVIEGVVRRDLVLPLGRLNGDEVRSLLSPTKGSRETTIDISEDHRRESIAPQFAERSVRSKRQETTTKCSSLKNDPEQLVD